MINIDRIVSSNKIEDDKDNLNFKKNLELRPKFLKDYQGQKKIINQLNIFIKACKMRNEALDHTLIFGPPGLGKTTLSHIIANELGVNLKQTSGPILEKAGDLAAILTSLEKFDVLFIDEIHRLNPFIEEILYPAMEDFQLDILIGDGPSAKSIKIDLEPFTLIGATTRTGLLTAPLRDRFGITQRLEFYKNEDLAKIIERSAKILDMDITKNASFEIAKCSRGTPRIANRILKRVRDYCQIMNSNIITQKLVKEGLELININTLGFDYLDINYLDTLINKFNGGPVGIDNLATSLCEEKNTILDVIEPFLIQQGFVLRTTKGRIATLIAHKYFKENNLIK